MVGKKGDVVNIPAPVRGVATEKGQNAAVTIQNNAESNVAVGITEHYEYSRMIEDIVEVQALSSLRKFYTDDAGYALARQIDTDLMNLGKSLGNGNGSTWQTSAAFKVAAGGGLEAYNGTAANVFTDEAFRALIQKMDDADVPMDDRCFVIPPSIRNTIMGLERYVSSDFTNGATVQNGKIGELYGIDIMVSTNVATPTGTIRAAQLLHKDTYILAEQQGIRSQTQYKQEFLGTLYTADTLYGVKTFRPDAGFILAVPS
tara:strand:- start:471 stop:1247 length:777 start_codon:yes stop_codon:yes gene_type:complete